MSHPLSRQFKRVVSRADKLYRQLLDSEIPFTIRLVAAFTLVSGLINIVMAGAIATQTIGTFVEMLRTPIDHELTGLVGFLWTLVTAVVNVVGLLLIIFSILEIVVCLLLAALSLTAGTTILSFKSFGPIITCVSQGLFWIQGSIVRASTVRATAVAQQQTESLTLPSAIHTGLWSYYAPIAPLITIALLVIVFALRPNVRQRFW